MKINTFWNIVLKVIGLWLFMNCLYVFPQITSFLLMSQVNIGWNTFIPDLIYGLLALIAYLFISTLFLFKSSLLVSILKLERHFEENRIDITVSQDTVLKIVIILFGGLTLINSIPNLIRETFQFLKQNELFKNYRDASWLVFHSINSLIGYLLITNSKEIANLINKKTEK
jgi:hypothetical protein